MWCVVVVWGLTTMNADAYVNESEGTLLIGYLGSGDYLKLKLGLG